MKVLLINDFEHEGGAEKVFRDTKKLLQDQFAISSFIGSQHHSVRKNPLGYIYSTVEKRRLKEILKSNAPDIIHVHVFSHLLTSSVFSAIRKYKSQVNKEVKVIYTAHDFYLVCPNSGYLSYHKGKAKTLPVVPPSLSSMLTLRLDKRSFLHSWLKKVQWTVGTMLVDVAQVMDIIITPSVFLRDVLRNKFTQKEFVVVRNPIESRETNHSIKNFEKGMRMVYFGRLSEEKGVCEFLQNISSSDLNFSLDIIGDGPEKERIQEVISLEGLKDRVQLLGKIEHSVLMTKLERDYHAMVLPSIWYENAPLSLVEASKFGLAILASNLGGIKEISDLCGNNFLFDPSSKSEIHAQLMECFNYLQSGLFKPNSLDEFSEAHYKKKIAAVYNR